MKKISLIISLALALMGCTKQGAVPEAQVAPGIQDDNPGISRDIVSLTADDAVTVAQMFCSKEGKTKSGGSKIVEDVATLSGKDGSANMYAVNFSNDEGFILVSATKKFFPILAEVEKGKFDDSIYQTGASVLLDEYNQSIDYYEAIPQEEIDESLAAMWRAYEKKAVTSPYLKTKSYEDDLMNLVPAAIHEWAEDGYSAYPLCNAQGCGIPQSLYNQWYDIASSEANQHYSFEENSFIIARNEELASPIGPLMSTKWHQLEPYNLSVPYFELDDFAHKRLGQHPVIVGEIMKYHQRPNIFSWLLMPDQLSEDYPSTSLISEFLYSVGQGIGFNYQIDLYTTTNFAIYSYLGDRGYSCSEYSHTPFFSEIETEISSYNPVFAFGTDQSGVDHIWAVDGVKTISVYRRYSLKIISLTDYPSLYYWSPCQDYVNFEYGYQMYHLHLGVGGIGDGWYYQARNFTPSTDYGTKYATIHVNN